MEVVFTLHVSLVFSRKWIMTCIVVLEAKPEGHCVVRGLSESSSLSTDPPPPHQEHEITERRLQAMVFNLLRYLVCEVVLMGLSKHSLNEKLW